MPEVMILGATGRTGRAIAARLDASGTQLVLFGRVPSGWSSAHPRCAGVRESRPARWSSQGEYSRHGLRGLS